MKLYYCPGHLSFAVHVILMELNVPFEAIHVSIKEGATQTAEFRRLNPKGRVPVLQAGPVILTEASAIMLYLALQHPEHHLVPTSPMGMARAIEWTNWLTSVLAWAVGQNVRPERLTDQIEAHDGIRRKGFANILDLYSQIENKLSGCEWALAEGYSIVDPKLAIFYKWGHLMGMDMRNFPNWTAHTKRIEQRPAVQAVLKIENISLWT
jgi:glutathione S-transferase